MYINSNFDIFLNENVAAAKTWLTKNNIDLNNKDFVTIKSMLQPNPNLTLMFTKFHFVNNVSIEELQTLYDTIKKTKDILNKLPKKLDSYENPEELSDNLRDLNKDQSLKKFENELPLKLKSLFKNINQEQLSNFLELTPTLFELHIETRKRFFNKISKYNTIEELYNDLNILIENSTEEFSFEKISNDIKNTSGADIKYENSENDVIVARIYTYSAAEELMSDTSWCIRNSTTFWNKYIGGVNVYNSQYIIYNFNVPKYDQMSMVGITVEKDGSINTAHKRNDKRIYDDDLFEFMNSLNIPKTVLEPLSKSEIKEKKDFYESLDTFKNNYYDNIYGKRTYNYALKLINIVKNIYTFDKQLDNILYLVIYNDDVNTLKTMVDKGLNINAIINHDKLDNNKICIYDAALILKSENIKSYLEENNVKKISDNVSFYLYTLLENSSDEEVKQYIKNNIKRLSKNSYDDDNYDYKRYKIIKVQDNDKKSIDLVNISFAVYIFDNKSLDIFNYFLSLIPEDMHFDFLSDIINSFSSQIIIDKLIYLLNILLDDYEKDKDDIIKLIPRPLMILLQTKDLKLIEEYIKLFMLYDSMVKNLCSKIFEDYESLKLNITERDDIIYLFFKHNFYPKIDDIILLLDVLKNKGNYDNDLQKIIKNGGENITSALLTDSINDKDKFFSLIKNGIDINQKILKQYKNRENILEYELFDDEKSNHYNYKYGNDFKNIHDDVFEYIVKNCKLTESVHKDKMLKNLISIIIKRKKYNLIDFLIKTYKPFPDLRSNMSYSEFDLYNEVIDILIELNDYNNLRFLVNDAKEKGFEINYDFKNYIIKKDKVNIKKYYDIGLRFSVGSLTALFETEDEDLLDFVLSLGVSLKPKYDDKYYDDAPSISELIKNENLHLIKKIFDNGYKVNWTFGLVDTVKTGNIELVKYLSNYCKDSGLSDAFFEAIKIGNLPIMKFLYTKGKFTEKDFVNKERWHYSSKKDIIMTIIREPKTTLDILKYVLSLGYKFRDKDYEDLFEFNRIDFIEYLISINEFKLDIKYLKNIIKSETLQFLLDNNIKINENTPIQQKQDLFEHYLRKATPKCFRLLLDNFKNLINFDLTEIVRQAIHRTSKDDTSSNFSVSNILTTFKEFPEQIKFYWIYDDLKKQRFSNTIREEMKDIIKNLNKKSNTKNENYTTMKHLKLFEDYFGTAEATEVKPAKPDVKPDTKPRINPMQPPKPVVIPNPKAEDEEKQLDKVVKKFNRLKQMKP